MIERLAAGTGPALVTSLARRGFGADGRIHPSLTPYVEVVKWTAAEGAELVPPLLSNGRRKVVPALATYVTSDPVLEEHR